MIGLAALAALLAAASPFQAEQPEVREGNERLVAGDAAGALERYAAAERQVGAHPEIDFDRGDALARAGRVAEAQEAWRRAARGGDGRLASRALQNLATSLDAAGDRDGAVTALGDALARDPENGDARYDLEVLLRRRRQQEDQPPKQQGQPQPGQPQQGQPQPGQPQQGQPQPGQPQQGQQGGEPQQPRPSPQQQQPQQSQRPGERQQEPSPAPGADARTGEAARDGDERERQDGLRMLDALRARERNMPLDPVGRRESRRRDVERDW